MFDINTRSKNNLFYYIDRALYNNDTWIISNLILQINK